jgi:DNA-binding transcriptional ArsR family regulator
MLGVHRPTVTHALSSLRRAGLVESSRAEIVIRDRPGLEAAACECYRLAPPSMSC